MSYAAQSDIIELYGLDALVVADRDGDGSVDAPAVEKALAAASDEIDTYLGVRYRVPLDDPAPALIIRFAIDIALYQLATTAAMASEEARTRYEDAIAALRRIGKGEQALILTGDAGSEDDDAGPRPIVTGGPERLFSREQMRDL